MYAGSRAEIERNEIQMKINNKTEDLQDRLRASAMTNARLEEKVKILEAAFKNMGFDVKDMKEILGKLVDGVVSKNKINLIKS